MHSCVCISYMLVEIMTETKTQKYKDCEDKHIF